jgi:SAM-dependent methyltransferase
MAIILEQADGRVTITPTGRGHRIEVEPADRRTFVSTRLWNSRYPVPLIERILAVKGIAWLCDEIRRDEDPAYVQNDIRHDVLGYLPPVRFAGKRLLELGCGSGASTMILSRLLPETDVVGVELEEDYLEIARMRAEFYGCARVRLLRSPNARSLPPDLGRFDFVLLSAVFEHLLPDERTRLLPLLWSHLDRGGILFVNQTPHRWFPTENHTTELPLLNYLPDRLALMAAHKLSGRNLEGRSWPELLRGGIRGGTAREILGILRRAGASPRLLVPRQNGISGRLDLWYRSASARKPSSGLHAKRLALSLLSGLTGRVVVPTLSLAIEKTD